LHRSRARTRLEELRKHFTAKRLHRCHACGWRGWWDVQEGVMSSPTEATVEPLDMTLLDDPPR
jgi:hypothetical protein